MKGDRDEAVRQSRSQLKLFQRRLRQELLAGAWLVPFGVAGALSARFRAVLA